MDMSYDELRKKIKEAVGKNTDVPLKHTFGVSLDEVAGKQGYKKMMDEGRTALVEIAKRLPDHFEDLKEDVLIELFRQAGLFMISNGFKRSDYEKLERENLTEIFLKLCPDFPTEHIDAFHKLDAEYHAKWLKKRREEFDKLCAK